MESFGLFDLLKSMLLFKGEPSAPSSNSAQSSSPVTQAEGFSQSVSPQTKTENVNTFPPIETSTAPNAYVDFLNRHDELSKRRKKK